MTPKPRAGWALKPPPRNRKVIHHHDRVEGAAALGRGIEMEAESTPKRQACQAGKPADPTK